MAGDFNFGNILSEEEAAALFTDDEDVVDSEENTTVSEDNNNTVEEPVETPESVDSADDTGEEDIVNQDDGTLSKSNNFYSSIASALKTDVLSDLPEDLVNNVKSAEDFANLFDTYVQNRLDEKQRRIDEALNAGVQPTEIQTYENTISYLKGLNRDTLSAETDEGETLRKQLIYADYINRGYSQSRAEREVKKSLDSGSDIEDALEAVKSNLDYYQDKYDDIISQAKAAEEERAESYKKDMATLKKGMLDSTVLGDLQVDKRTRERAYESVTKTVYTDPKSGEAYTAVQKYEHDNPVEFMKNVGLLYTLTDGFKNVDKLVNGKVKKEMKRNLRALEDTLTGSSRTMDGSLNFMSGVTGDSPISGGKKILDLDL